MQRAQQPRLGRVEGAAPPLETVTQIDGRRWRDCAICAAAGRPILYSKLVDLFQPASAEAMAELEAALAADDFENGGRRLPQIGLERRQCGSIGLRPGRARSGEGCAATRQRAGRGVCSRRSERRMPGSARGIDAAAIAGERMSAAFPRRPSPSSPTMRISGACCWPKRPPASGLAALSFDNGVEALEAALSQEVAIVLLDVDMPGMDGYAVCRRLRAEPRFATVPIVMVTGHEDSAAISRAFEAGATDFISKPVNWALLAAPPRVHPAQCRRRRTHREAGVLRYPDRACRIGSAASRPPSGCSPRPRQSQRAGRRDLRRPQQLQARQRHVRAFGRRRGAARTSPPSSSRVLAPIPSRARFGVGRTLRRRRVRRAGAALPRRDAVALEIAAPARGA